jgi:2-methylcitrate dehydratase PrpD
VNLINNLVDYAVSLEPEKIPPDVLEVAKQCALDWLGSALAGSRSPPVDIIVDTVSSEKCNGTLIGRETHASLLDAAFINGTAGHAVELDNVLDALGGHPTATILPALFAMSEIEKTSGRLFLAAIVVGIEIQCRVAALIGKTLRQSGFHSTSFIGTLGAAVAAGYLAGLTKKELRSSLVIAFSQASGGHFAFGTMLKPVQTGNAAMNGVRATLLAKRGLVVSTNPLAPPNGFSGLFGSIDLEKYRTANEMNIYFTSETIFKDYPCCFALHGVVDAALQIKALAGYNIDLVGAIEVEVHPGVSELCNFGVPESTEQTRFSVPYAVAMSLSPWDPTSVNSWSINGIAYPPLEKLIKSVRLIVRPPTENSICKVKVIQFNGELLVANSKLRKPSADLKGQWEHLLKKFRRYATPILDKTRIKELVEDFEVFDELLDVAIVLRKATAATHKT